MNAVLIRKRNESVNRMWACLAGAEAAVLILSSDLARQSTACSTILCIACVLAVVILGLAAPVHYLLACERYINARGNTKVFTIAGGVLITAIVWFFAVSILADLPAPTAFYLVLPVTFSLSALLLKLIPDRG